MPVHGQTAMGIAGLALLEHHHISGQMGTADALNIDTQRKESDGGGGGGGGTSIPGSFSSASGLHLSLGLWV